MATDGARKGVRWVKLSRDGDPHALAEDEVTTLCGVDARRGQDVRLALGVRPCKACARAMRVAAQ